MCWPMAPSRSSSGTAVVHGRAWRAFGAGFFLATALAGVGFGAGFQGAVRTVLPTAKRARACRCAFGVFVVSYLAMGVPAVVAGYLVSHGGALLPTAQHFGIVVETLATFALLGTMLRRTVRAV